MVLIHHHIKYKEIHGVDEVVLMEKGEHRKLHNKLRKEGKCNIPPLILQGFSKRASCEIYKEKRRAYWRAYYETHKEERNATARVYWKNHRKERNAYMLVYTRAYRIKNKISMLRPDLIAAIV